MLYSFKKKIKNTLISLGLYNPVINFYFFLGRIFVKKFYLGPSGYILLYHRVASVKDDPLSLSVSPETFSEHLKFLKENFNVVSLKEIADMIRNKNLKNKSVAITFDDGYVDNLQNALPILEQNQIPATIFVTSNK